MSADNTYGKMFADDRGTFFDMIGPGKERPFEPKRMYVCENFSKDTIRGFHYHDIEQKLFTCVKGAILFQLIPMNKGNALEWSKSGRRTLYTEAERIVLYPGTSLHIPAKYANAWKPLTDDAILVGCSSTTIKESVNDDIRIDPHIVAWTVEDR